MPVFRISAGFSEDYGSLGMVVQAVDAAEACREAIRRVDDGEESTGVVCDSATPTVVWCVDELLPTGEVRPVAVPSEFGEESRLTPLQRAAPALLAALKLAWPSLCGNDPRKCQFGEAREAARSTIAAAESKS